MRTALRAALSFLGVGALMLAFDAVTKRRGGRAMRKLLGVVRPPAVSDTTLAERVRAKLDRIARSPELITVSVEHGCVELRGPIATHERAEVVWKIARVKGVDSVVDLMTEPERGSTRDGTLEARAFPATHVP